MSNAQSPILVTGLPRSGTSWVGKMLEASRELVYVNEPMNPQHPPGHSPGVLDVEVRHRFQYLTDRDASEWGPALDRTARLSYGIASELRVNRGWYDLARMAKYGAAFTIGRLAGRRALLDDPFAVLAADWITRAIGARAIVLVRNPVSLVGSWDRLGWSVSLSCLLEQRALVEDYLQTEKEDLRAAERQFSATERHAVLWRAVYSVVERSTANNADVRIVRYEDLASEPVKRFAEIYEWLGLDWSPRSDERIRRATSGALNMQASHRWSFRGGVSRTAFRRMDSRNALVEQSRRLSNDVAERVRELTEPVARRWY